HQGLLSELVDGPGDSAGYDSDRDGGESIRPSFVVGRQSFGEPEGSHDPMIQPTNDRRPTT
ncbi:MAG: hypothetical protein WAL71_06325, partial [Terriglobales bacterium]